MKPLALLYIIFFLSNNSVTAQVNFTNEADTIGYGKHNDTYYFYHNKKISESKLKPFLIQYNSSAIEYRKYSNWSTPGTIILLVGLIAGVIDFTKSNKEPFWNPYSVVLFAGDGIGIPLRIISFKHLKKSVKLYNQEILSR